MRMHACCCAAAVQPESVITPATPLLVVEQAITDYMRTGRFVWRPTGPWRPVMYTNPDGPPKLDYVGLNYYSRCCRLLGLPLRHNACCYCCYNL